MYFAEIDDLIKSLSSIELKKNEYWWISVAADSRPEFPGLLKAVNYRKINIYGSLVPGIIWEGINYFNGFGWYFRSFSWRIVCRSSFLARPKRQKSYDYRILGVNH